MGIFYLKDPDCVFIHITKTGGTSVRRGVWQSNYEGPCWRTVPEDWRHMFKFAFVRHPYDRFLSAFKMFTGPLTDAPNRKMPSDFRPLTLDMFMDIVEDESIIFDERRKTFEERIRHHAIPQTHPFNSLSQADFVGRFENLAADFAHVAAQVGVTSALPHMRVSVHRPWREELPEHILQRCRHYYREDFAALGYEM